MAEAQYVSQKLSKIRWKPSSLRDQGTDLLVTGSSERKASTICVWSVLNFTNEDAQDFESERLQCVCNVPVHSSVSDLKYLKPNAVVAGLENGDVMLMTHNAAAETLDVENKWSNVHHAGLTRYPCTSVDARIPDIVSAGEDGSINHLRMGCEKPLRTIVGGDSCPITAMTFIRQSEVCTVNKIGQLKFFDLRDQRSNPVKIIATSEKLIALESISCHSSRPHVMVTGGADGCVTILDMRKDDAPMTRLQVHDMEVWETHFHPTSPDSLFTCSEDGSVRRLDINYGHSGSMNSQAPLDVIEICSQNVAINSIDVSEKKLAGVTDSEAIYVMDNPW